MSAKEIKHFLLCSSLNMMLFGVIFMGGARFVHATEYLYTTCSGPKGTCAAGYTATVSSTGMGEGILVSKHVDITSPVLVVGYCNKSNGYAYHCDKFRSKSLQSNFLDGTHTWGEVTSFVTGTYQLKDLSQPNLGEGYCISAWIYESSNYNRNLSYGSNYYSTSAYATCAGKAPPPTPPAPTCTVNNGGAIDVNFGNIERGDLSGDTGLSKQRVQKSMRISCTGSDRVDFTVAMNMTGASWNNKAIQSSNGNVGVVVNHGSSALGSGNSFGMTVNGSATADLEFVAVRNPNVTTDQVSTGGFRASATLVVTQQ